MADAQDKDEIFELRCYTVAAGRDLDMRRRLQEDLCRLFPRNGIRPLACWSAIAAPSTPMLVYITPFHNLIERNRSWASFYADPEWQEVRTRTNAGSELVEDFEISFLRGIGDWLNADRSDGAVDEILFLKTLIGKSGAAASALKDSELPARARAGATAMGVFDVMTGVDLPAAISFLRWRDWQSWRDSEKALERDAVLLDRRSAERAEYGQPLVGRTGSWLLDPIDVDWN